MRRFGKWVVTLGIIGVAPGVAMAGPLSVLGLPARGSSEQVAVANPNQAAAERIARALRAGGFKGSDIQVQFRDGTAVLIGSVATARQRQQAGALARAVRGVKRVENKLVVGQARLLPRLAPMRTANEVPRGAAPSSIRQVAHETPAKEPTKSLSGVRNFGHLFRSSRPAPEKAKKPKKLPVFKGTLGKFVAKPLAKESAKPTNQQVAEAIAAALRKAKLSGYEMEVVFKDGVATVKGTIESPDQKQRVSQVVAQVPGVKVVKNQLAVKTSRTQPSSQDIANRIARALRQAKLSSSGIEIEVRDGVAKLTGTIVDPLQKAKVAEIAKSVPGVTSVDNRLVLMQKPRTLAKSTRPARQAAAKKAPSEPRLVSREAPAQESNQVVAERIAAALKEAGLSGYDIAIEVKDGVATLRGKIASVDQKKKVTECVLQVAGVETVKNELSLLSPKTPRAAQPASMQVASSDSPQAVARKIAAALRQIDLRGCDITVRYQNGTAILLGTVSSPLQAQQAAEVASRVPGVRVVENRLGAPGSPPVAARQGFVPSEMRPQTRPVAGIPVPLPIAPVALPSSPAGPSGPALPTGTGQLVAADGQPTPAAPPAYGHPGSGASHVVYNMPRLPEYAWPAYAAYPNYAQLTYPKQYSASAWPYIGPFYPYPQIPLGWRQVQLEWDDGYWNLNFRPRTNKWWWFLNPENW
ncbi:MAG TPA: BON domain-containing protein [Planctomycetaceae bacterium]|nr:BON domain-containing protein [Planctomycetaceae bacterium]